VPHSRWTFAAVLVGGASLQLIEEMIEPPFTSDADRFSWMASHTTLHAVDVVIGLAAVPLLIASVLMLSGLATKMSRLARVGSSLCVVGFCGLAAVHGFEAAEVAFLDAGVPPQTVALAVGQVQPALGVPMLAMFLGAVTVGLPMLLIALWRSHAVPVGAILTAFAFMVLDFAGPETPFPAHALSFIAFTWMAAAIVLGRGSATNPS